jgi:hypothetical protein
MITFALTNTNLVSSTISLQFSQQDYTWPVAPTTVVLSSAADGTMNTEYTPVGGGTSAGYYQTWVDADNILFGHGTITSGLQGGSFEGVGNTSDLTGVSNDVVGVLSLGNDNSDPKFSMTGQIDITFDPNESINFTATQSLGVPEPVSLAVWSVLGCVAAAGAAFRRRRPS